jgi:hypothetical protein
MRFPDNVSREDQRTGFAESGVSGLWRCTRSALRTKYRRAPQCSASRPDLAGAGRGVFPGRQVIVTFLRSGGRNKLPFTQRLTAQSLRRQVVGRFHRRRVIDSRPVPLRGKNSSSGAVITINSSALDLPSPVVAGLTRECSRLPNDQARRPGGRLADKCRIEIQLALGTI